MDISPKCNSIHAQNAQISIVLFDAARRPNHTNPHPEQEKPYQRETPARALSGKGAGSGREKRCYFPHKNLALMSDNADFINWWVSAGSSRAESKFIFQPSFCPVCSKISFGSEVLSC